MPVRCKIFRSALSSWETLFEEAAAFASQLPPERLISISHSEDDNEGVVAVWYRVAGERGAADRAGAERQAGGDTEGGEATQCMQCGKAIPADAERCASCGWSWGTAGTGQD
jgi:hypothetical protein